eukprot:Nk52_evm1s1556 gene=Nk52_evmTU1s1556
MYVQESEGSATNLSNPKNGEKGSGTKKRGQIYYDACDKRISTKSWKKHIASQAHQGKEKSRPEERRNVDFTDIGCFFAVILRIAK